MMKLIITRHGETTDNREGIATGQLQGKLTSKGLAQAKALGKRLKDEKIDIIYSSDLKRTVDTAEEISKYHPDAEFIVDERIRERSLGDLEGKHFPEDWNWENLPEGVETDFEIYERAKEFLDDRIFSKADELKGKTIVIACHGGMKMAILCVITETDPKDFNRFEGIGNTAISIYILNSEKNFEELGYNCTSHLE